jgi:hypothetical protein
VRAARAIRRLTFRRLEAVSFTHSLIYLSLLLCAFVLGNPQPATFVLGLSHGVLWIGMSLVCLAAARLRVIPFWLAVTVAILGGLGPFAGTIGFVVCERRRRRGLPDGTPVPPATAGPEGAAPRPLAPPETSISTR